MYHYELILPTSGQFQKEHGMSVLESDKRLTFPSLSNEEGKERFREWGSWIRYVRCWSRSSFIGSVIRSILKTLTYAGTRVQRVRRRSYSTIYSYLDQESENINLWRSKDVWSDHSLRYSIQWHNFKFVNLLMGPKALGTFVFLVMCFLNHESFWPVWLHYDTGTYQFTAVSISRWSTMCQATRGGCDLRSHWLTLWLRIPAHLKQGPGAVGVRRGGRGGGDLARLPHLGPHYSVHDGLQYFQLTALHDALKVLWAVLKGLGHCDI